MLLSCTRTESPSHPATTVPAGAGRSRLWDPRGPEGPPGRKRLRTHLYFCFPNFHVSAKILSLVFYLLNQRMHIRFETCL